MKQLAWYVTGGALFVWSVGAAVTACGGSTDDAAITNGATDDASASSSSSSSSSGGASSSSSGGPTDGGATDAGTKTDGGSSSGATPNAVACGTATCTTPAQKCCTTFQQGAGIQQTCIAAAADCQGANAACDDVTDCPQGQVCCAGGGGGGSGAGFGAKCATDCGQGIQMCKAANECIGDGGPCTEYSCLGGNKVSLCKKPPFGCQ